MNLSKRMWLYLGLLFLALSTMYLVKPKGEQEANNQARGRLPRDYQEVKSEGILRVMAPYQIGTDSTKQGTENAQQLIHRLRKRSGLEIELSLEDNTHRALEALLLGEVDLILEPVAYTAELDSSLYILLDERLADPIYLVQRRDSAKHVSKQLELEGREVTLPLNSELQLFLHHISEEMGLNIAIRQDSLYNTEQLIMKVQAASIDYTLCSGEEAKRYARHFPDLDFTLPISHNLRRGWLTRRASPILADSLRRWLSAEAPQSK